MAKPTEVRLKYKDDGSGVFSLIVDEVPGSSYRWQHCKAGTADWETINAVDRNTYTTAYGTASQGDKYRCLILSGNKVISFSKVLTIGQEKYQSKNEYNYQGKYKHRTSTPSVSDTDGMEGHEFEVYCADVLRKNGFFDVQVTQGSGDYGIDILAKKDSISYAIQCKCYSSSVGNKAVQEAYSGKSFYNCMVAAVLTNNYFTDAAIETAKRNSVVLWNRDYLDNMIKNPDATDYDNREKERQERTQRERARQEQTHREQERQRQWQEQQRRRQQEDTSSATTDFFKGCTTWEQVKERYRKLMQMYHPDHAAGDEEYTKIINDQYSKLKEKYGQ